MPELALMMGIVLLAGLLAKDRWTPRPVCLPGLPSPIFDADRPPALLDDPIRAIRFGGPFGGRDRKEEKDEPPSTPWRLPGGLRDYDPYGDEEASGQVRVLPPEPPGDEAAADRLPITDDETEGAQRGAELVTPDRQIDEPIAVTEPLPDEGGFGDLLPSAGSERLERWGELLQQQQNYYAEAVATLGDQTVKLSEYLEEQRVNMQRMMERLESQLRPLKDYVALEENNLEKLLGQMERQPSGLVSGAFEDYIEAQRERTDQGKREIGAHYQPFREYFAEQQNLVETLLSKFDDEFKRLSTTLTDQRKLMDRIQEGFGDTEYVTALDYLTERQRAWLNFSRSPTAQPAEIYSRLGEIYRAFTEAHKDARGVLDHLFALSNGADERLAEYVRPDTAGPGRRAQRPPAADALPPAVADDTVPEGEGRESTGRRSARRSSPPQ